MAAGSDGLVVFPSVPNLHLTLRVQGIANGPFTLEASSTLGPATWTPLLTTNVQTYPLDYVAFDVKSPGNPQKYYRLRHP